MSGASNPKQVDAGSTKRFLTEDELAELTGIAVRTLQKWRVFGRGPRFKKIGGTSVRYDRADVEEFLRLAPTGGGKA